jgi:hypothetical protein
MSPCSDIDAKALLMVSNLTSIISPISSRLNNGVTAELPENNARLDMKNPFYKAPLLPF